MHLSFFPQLITFISDTDHLVLSMAGFLLWINLYGVRSKPVVSPEQVCSEPQFALHLQEMTLLKTFFSPETGEKKMQSNTSEIQTFVTPSYIT